VRRPTALHFMRVGILSLGLAVGPLAGVASAQAADPARTPAETGRVADTREDDDFEWGWLGLLGLLGLGGLLRRQDTRSYRASNAATTTRP
jgi:hypothetical protein